MEYKNCPLYALKSKTLLKKLLHINTPDLIKQSYIASLVEPYIDHSPKDRLDDLADVVLGNGAVELSQPFGRIFIRRLSHRIDFAYGYTELLVAKLHALNDPTVVGDQHNQQKKNYNE